MSGGIEDDFYAKFFSLIYLWNYLFLQGPKIWRQTSARIIVQRHFMVKTFISKIFLGTKISIFQLMLARLYGAENGELPRFAGSLWRWWPESLTSLLINIQFQEEEKEIIANARWVVDLVWGTMTMNKAISSPYRSQVWRSLCKSAGTWKVMTNNCCMMRLSAKDLHNGERLT